MIILVVDSSGYIVQILGFLGNHVWRTTHDRRGCGCSGSSSSGDMGKTLELLGNWRRFIKIVGGVPGEWWWA